MTTVTWPVRLVTTHMAGAELTRNIVSVSCDSDVTIVTTCINCDVMFSDQTILLHTEFVLIFLILQNMKIMFHYESLAKYFDHF